MIIGERRNVLRLTPEQRAQREALCDKTMESLTPEQRRQMEELRDKMHGNQGATTAPSAGAALGTSSDI